MSKLALFALLCLFVVLLLRSLNASGRRRPPSARGRGRKDAPAASPDEIVDVSFEEHPAGKDRPGSGT